MSQVEEQQQASKTSQDRRAAENLRLYSYMEDNFTRIFSLLAPIMSFSIQNETHIRQIMFSLQHPEVNLANGEFDNREFVRNLLKTQDKVAGSSNGQTSEESKAENATKHTHDKSMTDNNEDHQNDSKAGASTDDMKEHPSPSTSKGQQSPESGEKVKPRRKRKLNDENPIVIHCTDCNQIFRKGDGSYTRHLKEMKCSPHECPKCGKRFKKKSYLNIHLANHSRQSLDEPSTKKIRVKEEDDKMEVPHDLDVKKEDESNNSEFFSSLNLFENHH